MKTHRHRGVSLIELMIAMTIILIVGLSCVQVLQYSSKSTLPAFRRIQASQYLDQIHNHLRLSNLEELKGHYRQFPQIVTDPNFSAEVEVRDTAKPEIKMADITVRWNPNPEQHSLTETVTLIPK